jgi:hypothetical protein
MFGNLKDRMVLSGFAVLTVGIALLVFTFISAYGFLNESLSIVASADLAKTFGETLAPLIGTCIRVMYLGVMGWVGSLITIRGVTVITHGPDGRRLEAPKKVEAEREPQRPEEAEVEKPQRKSRKVKQKKSRSKAPSEPEFLVMPPEQPAQHEQQTGQSQH